MRPPTAGWIAALGLSFALAGCGARAEGPPEVLSEYRRAISSRRWREAYRLMSAEFRRSVSYPEFARALEDNPREVEDSIAALTGSSGEASVEARVHYGLGEEMAFTLEDGRWVIASPVVDFYAQGTPREALRSFVRAMERRRLDVLPRFVPNEYRRGMNETHLAGLFEGERAEETETLLQNLRAHLDDPIEVTGERAAMPYAERFTVLFVREDGVWKIEDPD